MARRTREEIEAILSARNASAGPNPALLKLFIGLMAGGLLMTIGVVAFGSQIRIFTGNATAQDIYGACMSAAQDGAAKAKDPMGKAMIAGMMTEMCTAMRDECGSFPNGEKCFKIKEAARIMARS